MSLSFDGVLGLGGPKNSQDLVMCAWSSVRKGGKTRLRNLNVAFACVGGRKRSKSKSCVPGLLLERKADARFRCEVLVPGSKTVNIAHYVSPESGLVFERKAVARF